MNSFQKVLEHTSIKYIYPNILYGAKDRTRYKIQDRRMLVYHKRFVTATILYIMISILTLVPLELILAKEIRPLNTSLHYTVIYIYIDLIIKGILRPSNFIDGSKSHTDEILYLLLQELFSFSLRNSSFVSFLQYVLGIRYLAKRSNLNLG